LPKSTDSGTSVAGGRLARGGSVTAVSGGRTTAPTAAPALALVALVLVVVVVFPEGVLAVRTGVTKELLRGLELALVAVVTLAPAALPATSVKAFLATET
jgi:hypothetical protein